MKHSTKKNLRFVIYSLFLFLMLTGCSTVKKNLDWSNDMPPMSYFVQYYQQDKEHQQVLGQESYLLWVRRFYEGWTFYRRGWIQAINEMEATLEKPEDKQYAKETMTTIGRLVSAEWAKNKHYRSINLRHVVLWGNSINASIVQHQQLGMLDAILADVNLLLEHKVEASAITELRYESYTRLSAMAAENDPFAM